MRRSATRPPVPLQNVRNSISSRNASGRSIRSAIRRMTHDALDAGVVDVVGRDVLEVARAARRAAPGHLPSRRRAAPGASARSHALPADRRRTRSPRCHAVTGIASPSDVGLPRSPRAYLRRAAAASCSLLWVLAAIGIVVFAKASGGRTFDNFKIPDAQSQTAADLLVSRFPQQSGTSATVVFQAKTGTLDEPAAQSAIAGDRRQPPEAPRRLAGRRTGRTARLHARLEGRHDRPGHRAVQRAAAGPGHRRVQRARSRGGTGDAGGAERRVRRSARRLRERQPHRSLATRSVC